MLKVVYSNRKTICLQVQKDGSAIVKAPVGTDYAKIEGFVKKHEDWLSKASARIVAKEQKYALSDKQKQILRARAKEYIPQRVNFFAKQMGVTPTAIKITSAKTRYGSCSAQNSLCFSLYLMLYSERAIDSVVVHELAHIRHKNHGRAFYNEIQKVMPDYKIRKKDLIL